ncbi:hypothetical protein PWP89_13115 [Stenotrophomonas rhizophila]|uniref:hypothetical protein n=1 Tax=Stenotrophomonas rhizophila TaxID=216778 RepID=UPI000B80F685|nr:hypothetical protein [Stenotrophomonas rhizophila]
MSMTSDFRMVGARFSRIAIDEHAFIESDADGFSMEIGVEAPKLSDQKYADRSVIEVVVGARAVGVNDDGSPVAPGDVFVLQCVGGFVGASPELDGNLDAFKPSAGVFSRALYWMLRERMQSIASVTILRHTDDLPWDLDESFTAVTADKASKPKKKAVKSEKAPQ